VQRAAHWQRARGGPDRARGVPVAPVVATQVHAAQLPLARLVAQVLAVQVPAVSCWPRCWC
jgi:hypothetical protein